MKFLLMFLLTFSVFAGDKFAANKEETLAKMHAANASPADIECVEKAMDKKAMKHCKKAMKKAHKSGKKAEKKAEAPAAAAPTAPAEAAPATK